MDPIEELRPIVEAAVDDAIGSMPSDVKLGYGPWAVLRAHFLDRLVNFAPLLTAYEELERRLVLALQALCRLNEWDMLTIGPDGLPTATGDGYWARCVIGEGLTGESTVLDTAMTHAWLYEALAAWRRATDP